MATLLSITTRRRDGVKPGRQCQEQTVATRDAVAGARPSARLAAITAQYYRRWQPAAVEERLLVDLLVAADWQLRRLQAGRQWRPPEPA
jgi:hypothetical protein